MLHTAPVDKTVFQTLIAGLMGWVIYTFLYKPICCEPEPTLFTFEEVISIIHSAMDDVQTKRDKNTELDNDILRLIKFMKASSRDTHLNN